MSERVLPVEPTEEMMRAGLRAKALAESSDWSQEQILQIVWQAMVEAAPRVEAKH
jgi:hypothetical protein